MVPGSVRRVMSAGSLAEPLSVWGGALPPAPVLVDDRPVCVCSMRWEAVVWQVCVPCVFMLDWTVDCSGQNTCCGVHAHSLPTPHCWQSHFVTPGTVSTVMWVTVGGATWGMGVGSRNTTCFRSIGEGECVSECSPIKMWEDVVWKECTLCSCFGNLF